MLQVWVIPSRLLQSGCRFYEEKCRDGRGSQGRVVKHFLVLVLISPDIGSMRRVGRGFLRICHRLGGGQVRRRRPATVLDRDIVKMLQG